jgi:hypothetical protein
VVYEEDVSGTDLFRIVYAEDAKGRTTVIQLVPCVVERDLELLPAQRLFVGRVDVKW